MNSNNDPSTIPFSHSFVSTILNLQFPNDLVIQTGIAASIPIVSSTFRIPRNFGVRLVNVRNRGGCPFHLAYH